MLASLLRPRKGRRRQPENSPFSTPRIDARDAEADAEYFARRDMNADEDHYEVGDEAYEDDEPDDPILPIFSAEHLDRLPIYNLTHSIRLLVVQRCETTLSWDQLRSPQVSQFLVKPIQQEIQSGLFNRASIYALIANCLQFQKEGQANPGNVGVSKTRGMICELLAMRLLKEFSTRELIDALAYDFDPLQGLTPPATVTGRNKAAMQPRLARISTVEIAIRAQAKKFLAHPLVVQQLEAIWAGTIVFHSAADNLHRIPSKRPTPRDTPRSTTYGTMHDDPQSPDKGVEFQPLLGPTIRRTVTLYDPREASLFKLSRLRVPRYRQLFSTCSFAIMLGLFVAVLVEKSVDITALEVVFWFWSAGYMLDEVVGFTEQGFNLYILSVWNAFDLGILLLFVVYYVLRLYGILMPDVRKHHTANMAYDVLASTAVLLFPRLFSVLDHYRYFSQLLIAFRMMAVDLAAILVLIVICCSGFFVAFTLAFGDTGFQSGSQTAYALFQLVMGFTPAAWEYWSVYNVLGKAILTLFLFICHFLIVTILITVLTNSFMAVVQNANEEHQFLFAVNAISMVKSDALFSYIAPTNVIGWLLTPLRFVMPFRKFIKLNRTLIKATHFPILFSIFCYERLVLSRMAFQPEELVEQRGRSRSKFGIRGPGDLFSPGLRLREPSITTFQKDRALAEVFRRPYKETPTLRQNTAGPMIDRRKSSNVVRDWMQGMERGGAISPMEEPRSVLDRLETARRPLMRRAKTAQRMNGSRRMISSMARSVASDPDVISMVHPFSSHIIEEDLDDPIMAMEDDQPQQTDADGDDELVTNDENEDDRLTLGPSVHGTLRRPDLDKENQRISVYESSNGEDYFRTPMASKSHTPHIPSSAASAANGVFADSSNRRRLHGRNLSSTTILFSPQKEDFAGESHASDSTTPVKRPSTAIQSGAATPRTSKTPKRPALRSNNLSPRHLSRANSNLANFSNLRHLRDRMPSFNALALDLASDIGDNKPRVDTPGVLGGSFSTNMEMAIGGRGGRRFERSSHHSDESDIKRQEEAEERSRMNRIMLARMNTLEVGFTEILKEVRGLRETNVASAPAVPEKKEKRRKGKGSQPQTKSAGGSIAASAVTSAAASTIGDEEGDHEMSE
ncbi:uncharacterized protein K452DRAFT_357381 [Aplosporella prunicola CBS 121167]|uniref:Ion transport domain-containing protein n=1 Tax=Aplosporella prunicola CBS 121167 TaxID=1176127 RepID=A0A6A6BHZ0_9PEZI|nr:uncharacterized protein K452DRAFT_357381 [Aplosporella prunicola CBS 121167]KAF2143759.1 hypothetical protein K452DRAFT_357381 [Aplosporella prunicola CBS 121167]